MTTFWRRWHPSRDVNSNCTLTSPPNDGMMKRRRNTQLIYLRSPQYDTLPWSHIVAHSVAICDSPVLKQILPTFCFTSVGPSPTHERVGWGYSPKPGPHSYWPGPRGVSVAPHAIPVPCQCGTQCGTILAYVSIGMQVANTWSVPDVRPCQTITIYSLCDLTIGRSPIALSVLH